MNQRRKSGFSKLDELPTAADYIAGGVAPFLIMVMVGALVWFAQDLVYRGEHALRLRWTLFWFVIGMVGVSRIAIERTPAYAGLFALGLGGAVAILINQFFVLPPTGWLLLGLIWWCTNKLVWDCTLIDEREDASGEGLLEVAGMDETAGGEPRADVSVRNITVSERRVAKTDWWRRFIGNPSGPAGRPHAHGLWIIYFSLAALPLFGLGQSMLAHRGSVDTGLALLVVYLSAATGLLLLTSFLGLRRYLRQRRLKMPAAIAGTWIGVGALIALSVLLLSLVLPRPVGVAASNAGDTRLAGRKLNERSTVNDPQAIEEQPEGSSGDRAGDKGSASGESSNRDSATSDSASGRQAGGNQARDLIAERGQERPESQLPSLPAWSRQLGWWVVAATIVFVVVRYWREIAQALRELIASLRALFAVGAGARPRPVTSRGASAGTVKPRPRFADLPNPFRSPESPDPADAVQRTYEALECWAAERGQGRAPDMTATEFARQLVHLRPELSDGVRCLAAVYAGLRYADRAPQAAELPQLAELWTTLERGQ